ESMDGGVTRIGISGVNSKNAVLDPVFQDPLLFLGWRGFGRRRHKAASHISENRRPELRVAKPGTVVSDAFQTQAALLHSVAVTGAAIFLQDWQDAIIEGLRERIFGHDWPGGQQRKHERNPNPSWSAGCQ